MPCRPIETRFWWSTHRCSCRRFRSRPRPSWGLARRAAIDTPVAELLSPADAEAQGRTGFAAAIAQAADGEDPEPTRRFVRPWNTFGVRMRARIATCGPPRAALVVLENGAPPRLRAVESACESPRAVESA